MSDKAQQIQALTKTLETLRGSTIESPSEQFEDEALIKSVSGLLRSFTEIIDCGKPLKFPWKKVLIKLLEIIIIILEE